MRPGGAHNQLAVGRMDAWLGWEGYMRARVEGDVRGRLDVDPPKGSQ